MATGIVVVVFPSRTNLLRALAALQEQNAVLLHRAAIIAKAASGEIIILDDDLSPDEGGIAGGALGAAMTALGIVQLGALALPSVGPIIAIGAGVLVGGLVGNVTGRFAANLMDQGYANAQIEQLALKLEAGHPALVIEVDEPPATLKQLQQAFAPFQAELIEPLSHFVPPDAE